MDEDTCMVDMARYFLNFTRDESCGKCNYCRIGTKRMLEILERITNGQGQDGDIEKLEELAAKIKGQIVSVKVKGGASGKLHGKVTAKEVAEQLYKLTGTEIDKKKIEMPASIKEFGSYDAKVRLHVGVVAAFKVKVEEAPL